MHTVSLLDKKKNNDASLKKKEKRKKKKNCGGLLSIVCDFWVLVATVGVWKKWNLRFGKVWKKYGIFFSVVAADPVLIKSPPILWTFMSKDDDISM